MGDTHIEYHRARSVVSWPLVAGSPPLLESVFPPMTGLRERVLAAQHRGEDVLLAQESAGWRARTQVLVGGGMWGSLSSLRGSPGTLWLGERTWY